MTPTIRLTLLVCAGLVAATLAFCLVLATRTPARGGEAQDFWREIQSTPRAERVPRNRARLMQRKRRLAPADSHRAERRSIRLVGGRSAFDHVMVLRQPAAETPAAFADRVALPPPLEIMDMPLREPRLDGAPPRREPRPKPNDTNRQLACVAIVVAAVIAGMLASCFTQRGIIHASS